MFFKKGPILYFYLHKIIVTHYIITFIGRYSFCRPTGVRGLFVAVAVCFLTDVGDKPV